MSRRGPSLPRYVPGMSESLFHTILVGTDGSETAAHAIDRAAELSQLMGSSLAIVGAFGSAGEQAPLDAALEAAAAPLRAGGLDVFTQSAKGDPVDVLLEIAEARKVDLIVVGNRGMTGAKRLLVGSIPDKVSHRAHCSVLVAHTT